MEKTLRSFYEGSNADLGPVNMDSPPQTDDYLRWTGAYWAPASFEEPEKNLTETVRNAGFTMLPKGTPVKIVGNTGQEANVIAANATDTFPAHLILNHDLQAGASGEAVIIGFINNVSVPDASIFTGGQEVYLGPAPNGGWTTTRPTGTNKIQKLGIIVKPNPGANTISGIVNITDVPQDLPDLIQPVTYNDGGTSTIDAANGENFVFTLTANGSSTTIAMANIPSAGTRYELELHLTWTSGGITFPASWSNGEALPSEIGNYVITAVTIDGGTNFNVIVPGSLTETDPVFSAAPASGIVAGDISNWNTAYGWSDHATAGYLTTQDLNFATQSVTYNDGGTSTIDAANGENFVFTLTANGASTTIAVSNVPSAGTRYELELHLTWTSGAITFPASWSKGEALPSEIGKYVITAVTIDGGTSFKVTVLPEYNVEILLNITTTTSPQTFTLPMNPSGLYIATIDWGDGSTNEITAYNDADLTHSYASAGSYTIFLRGVIGGIYFNNTGDKSLVTSVDYKNATRIEQAFYGCSNLLSFNGQTSGITNFTETWVNCSSLTSFPLIDTSSGTIFVSTWFNCSGLTSFPLIDTSSGTYFGYAWYNCTSLTSFPLIDTSSGTNFTAAWQHCSSLTSFPLLDTSSSNTFSYAWYGCSSLTSFPAIDTSSGTSFLFAWYGCSSLTSFPLIDTSSGTNFTAAWQHCSSLTSFPLIDTSSSNTFSYAWYGCSSLTSFPAIDTSSGTSFLFAWYGCSSLTSFPLIDTSNGTNFDAAWAYCTGLTSFPLIDTSSGTNFTAAWQHCSSLTSFPLIDTSSGTSFLYAWTGCSALTSFPAINTSSGTNFAAAWSGCSSLTSFPVINTSSGTSFASAWQYCSSLTSFPAIDTSSGTSFYSAWQSCSSLTSFPLLDTSNGTNFGYAWYSCSSLTSFPAGFFDSWTGTPANNCFYNTWDGCTSLTPQSVENILVSIDTSGKSAPASGVDIKIDYNGNGLTAVTKTAINNLKAKGWTITINGVLE